MAYSAKISTAKGTAGAIDGAIASVLAAAVIWFLKQQITGMTPETENAIAVSVGTVVSAVIVAAKKFLENYLKHRNDGKPAAAPKAAAPAAPAAK